MNPVKTKDLNCHLASCLQRRHERVKVTLRTAAQPTFEQNQLGCTGYLNNATEGKNSLFWQAVGN